MMVFQLRLAAEGRQLGLPSALHGTRTDTRHASTHKRRNRHESEINREGWEEQRTEENKRTQAHKHVHAAEREKHSQGAYIGRSCRFESEK